MNSLRRHICPEGHRTTNFYAMRIQEAIESLEYMRDNGTKNVMLAYWEPYCFGMKEGKKWARACDAVDRYMDWSLVHEMLKQIIDETK